MAKFIVYYQTTASYGVEVEVDVSNLGGEAFYNAIRAAAEEADMVGPSHTLCHQCSGKMNLGDWDQDHSEDGIYRHE
jgi:hypothetical protein